MKIFVQVILSLLILVLAACNSGDRDLENYGDISTSPGGINLTVPAEHRGGWGRRDCALCHNMSLGLHRGPNSAIDADALNDLIRQNGGDSYCLTCHGPNGVN